MTFEAPVPTPRTGPLAGPHQVIRRAVTHGLPDKETPILAAAAHARADLLVTGDRRHFGPLFGRTVKGVRVLSLADGLAAVLASAGSGP